MPWPQKAATTWGVAPPWWAWELSPWTGHQRRQKTPPKHLTCKKRFSVHYSGFVRQMGLKYCETSFAEKQFLTLFVAIKINFNNILIKLLCYALQYSYPLVCRHRQLFWPDYLSRASTFLLVLASSSVMPNKKSAIQYFHFKPLCSNPDNSCQFPILLAFLSQWQNLPYPRQKKYVTFVLFPCDVILSFSKTLWYNSCKCNPHSPAECMDF